LQDENNKTSETTLHINEIYSNTFTENMDEKGIVFRQGTPEMPGEQKYVPAYEPDDGPLTNEQIEQVKETSAIDLAKEANVEIAEIEHPVPEVEISDEPGIQNNKEDEALINIMLPAIDYPLPIIRSPMPTSVAVVFDEGYESDENTDNLSKDKKKKIMQSENLIIRELTGHHFIPKRIYDTGLYTKTDINNSFQNFPVVYPKSSSWINKYKGQENG
jgi:hypothetical protein